MRKGTQRLPGLVLTDHEFDVPLRHDRPEAERLTVYAREVVAPDKVGHDLPWLVFLQGGPGFGSPRPMGKGGWIGKALERYRVLLLDQRGTARSTPVGYQSMARIGDAKAQAAYLKCFRADSIVQDCELIRRQLCGNDTKWSVLGQSFGGFCATHYLSAAPGGLREVIITGGLPPLTEHPDEIYRATYERVLEKNERYYERYPGDVERVKQIVDFLATHDVELPGGGRLSPRRFQQLGLSFGFSDGFEIVHYLLEDAFIHGAEGRELSYTFLRGVENQQHHETNPIFCALHEAAYCQGFASGWSAERIRREHPEFDPRAKERVLFTGEMIYPWMFEEYRRLRPLREAAEILARDEDWSPLYDKAVLNDNAVPAVAVVYVNDMYVDRRFSEPAAAEIRGLRTWITDEYEHNGLRSNGDRVLGHLLDMLHGEV